MNTLYWSQKKDVIDLIFIPISYLLHVHEIMTGVTK